MINKSRIGQKTVAIIIILVMLSACIGCSSKEEQTSQTIEDVNADRNTASNDTAAATTDTDTAANTAETTDTNATTAATTDTDTNATTAANTDTNTAAETNTTTDTAATTDINAGTISTQDIVETGKNTSTEPVGKTGAGSAEKASGKEAGENPGGGYDSFFDFEEIQSALDAGTVTIEELAQRAGMPADQLQAYLNMASNNPEGMNELSEMYKMVNTDIQIGELVLPNDSTEFSATLALQSLQLCTGNQKERQASLLQENGFEILMQNNYEKAYSDSSHTCAYTVGSKKISLAGKEKTLLLVVIRGTSGGEWISNFNFADSHSDDIEYAENFMYAAQSIAVELVPILISNPDAVILVSGHSRGAAAANLLGMLLNETKGKENIYCYTFATPNTYRGAAPKENCENIFNIINPCDVVTKMPLTGLGFTHVGTDIILPGDPEEIARLDASMDIMYQAAPSVKAYYEERHSLTGPGLSEDGFTAYEIMLAMASSMTGITSSVNPGIAVPTINEILSQNPGTSESDFAPLFGLLGKVLGLDGGSGVNIFRQHMPVTYMQLLSSMNFDK